nr:MAG TPA: hypothetical protein [Caudoviricetes sp.]
MRRTYRINSPDESRKIETKRPKGRRLESKIKFERN